MLPSQFDALAYALVLAGLLKTAMDAQTRLSERNLEEMAKGVRTGYSKYNPKTLTDNCVFASSRLLKSSGRSLTG
jgi:hypothetical protein